MEELNAFLLQFAESPWAPLCLLAHSYLESFFLIGAHDFFIVAVTLFKPHGFLLFTLASATGSALGGSSAYAVGYFGGRPLIHKVIPARIVDTIEHSYEEFGLWAVAFAGFTPVPYKVFAAVSGLFKIPYLAFVIVSFVSRFARFFLVSGLIFLFGPTIQAHLLTSLNIATLVSLSIIALAFFILRRIKKKKALLSGDE